MDWNEQDVMVLDVGLHTTEYPYCDNVGCWCHTDVSYHESVMHPAYLDEDVEQAYGFYEVERKGGECRW